jgi:transposase
MARKRIIMTKQNEILRLKGLGHSKTEVARLANIDRATVRKYWDGLPIDSISSEPLWTSQVDWEYLNKEMKTVSIKILYDEQKDIANLPSYQAFCEYIRKHKQISIPETTIKIHRAPGDSVEVDYSGDGVQILNPGTGEIYTAQLFVGALSFSGYFYGEFTLTQKLEDFIGAHKNMFLFFGGVTKYIVPDNCKTAIIKNNKMDPIVHPTYQDMCVHYGLCVDPADPQRPTHKPNVENGIGVIQKEFFPLIRNMTFTSLIDLNSYFRNWLTKKLEDIVRGRGHSRKYFYEQEKNKLRVLPENSYQLFYFKKAKLHPDCHFQHEKNYYSSPHNLVGKELDIKFNSKEVHAYYATQLIASHTAYRGSFHYVTNVAHYPEKKYIDMNFHLATCRRDAEQIGPITSQLIEKILLLDKHPLKNLRKVQGVLALKNSNSNEAMEYACEMAIDFNKYNYDGIKRFAKGYRPVKDDTMDMLPIRQQELICLQGGLK